MILSGDDGVSGDDVLSGDDEISSVDADVLSSESEDVVSGSGGIGVDV